jgi:hypothetical protein
MWDSLYEWIKPNRTMTLPEHQVAMLRKNASMVYSERHRLKELCAQVQANKARAAQTTGLLDALI